MQSNRETEGPLSLDSGASVCVCTCQCVSVCACMQRGVEETMPNKSTVLRMTYYPQMLKKCWNMQWKFPCHSDTCKHTLRTPIFTHTQTHIHKLISQYPHISSFVNDLFNCCDWPNPADHVSWCCTRRMMRMAMINAQFLHFLQKDTCTQTLCCHLQNSTGFCLPFNKNHTAFVYSLDCIK